MCAVQAVSFFIGFDYENIVTIWNGNTYFYKMSTLFFKLFLTIVTFYPVKSDSICNNTRLLIEDYIDSKILFSNPTIRFYNYVHNKPIIFPFMK